MPQCLSRRYSCNPLLQSQIPQPPPSHKTPPQETPPLPQKNPCRRSPPRPPLLEASEDAETDALCRPPTDSRAEGSRLPPRVIVRAAGSCREKRVAAEVTASWEALRGIEALLLMPVSSGSVITPARLCCAVTAVAARPASVVPSAENRVVSYEYGKRKCEEVSRKWPASLVKEFIRGAGSGFRVQRAANRPAPIMHSSLSGPEGVPLEGQLQIAEFLPQATDQKGPIHLAGHGREADRRRSPAGRDACLGEAFGPLIELSPATVSGRGGEGGREERACVPRRIT